MNFRANADRPSVLVTGASGFVGRVLCRTLVKGGWRVVAVGRRHSYNSGVAGVDDICLPMHSDTDSWQRTLASVQCVVHLAAQVHQLHSSPKSIEGFYRVNVEGTHFVAQQAALANVERFVFLSSIKVNGEGVAGRRYTADDVPKPVDPYGQSKLQAEVALQSVCLDHGMEAAIVRPPLVYGPGVRANFERLLGLAASGLPLPLRSIDNRRSLVSVWNLVNFIETVMTHPDAPGTWLVSDGDDLSTPDLVSRLSRLMHKKPKLFSFPPSWLKHIASIVGRRPEADRLCDSLQVDISPAHRKLNWQAPMGVEEGLGRTVEAFRMMRRV